MSGEDWKECNKSTLGKSDEVAQDHVDDDFGDFEGFEDVDELGASVAQPLPESLQANWASFPDYVPSQHTMSSALQPDLLPMQANLSDLPQPESHSSSRLDQELDLSYNNPGEIVNNATCLEKSRNSNISKDLPDVSPPHRTYADSSVLELPLVQPDLAGPDFQLNAFSSLQSKLPDISPQTQNNNLSHMDFLNINSQASSLPDINPVNNRGIHSSHTQPDLPCAKNQRISSFNVASTSGNSISVSSNQNLKSILNGETTLQQKAPAVSSSPLLPSSQSSPLSQSQPDFGNNLENMQQQLQCLHQQNERLVQEICEVKERTNELHRMFQECLVFMQAKNNNLKESSVSSLGKEMQQLSEIMLELQAEMRTHKREIESNSPSSLENILETFKETVESKMVDHQKTCSDNLQEIITHQEQNVKHALTEVQDNLFIQIDNHLQAFRLQVLDDVQKMFKENSAEGLTNQNANESIIAVKKAIEAFTLHMEEQKKRDERSTLVFTILDSLLMNTRRQLQDLLKPMNPPNS